MISRAGHHANPSTLKHRIGKRKEINMKTYVTFGQDHAHSVGGRLFDKDCVAVINHNLPEEGRKLAFEYFDGKFCFEYPESHWDDASMKYFPRGYIEVN